MRTPFCCYCYELEEPVALENRSSVCKYEQEGGVCAQRVVARDISSSGFDVGRGSGSPGLFSKYVSDICSRTLTKGVTVSAYAYNYNWHQPSNTGQNSRVPPPNVSIGSFECDQAAHEEKQSNKVFVYNIQQHPRLESIWKPVVEPIKCRVSICIINVYFCFPSL
jgi:hypothetical protein